MTLQCSRCKRELISGDKLAIVRLYEIDDVGRLVMIKQVSLACFPICKKKRKKRKPTKGGDKE